MPGCTLCNRVFRDKYGLSRHMSRIVPCMRVVETPLTEKDGKKSSLDGKKSFLDGKKSSLEMESCPKNSLDKQKNKCKFCVREFSSNGYLKKHVNVCKSKDDPIRLMELEQCIEPVIAPDCKTECRYCNVNLTRPSYLNKHLMVCKKKEEYKKELVTASMAISVNNGTVNNGNNNDTGANKR